MACPGPALSLIRDVPARLWPYSKLTKYNTCRMLEPIANGTNANEACSLMFKVNIGALNILKKLMAGAMLLKYLIFFRCILNFQIFDEIALSKIKKQNI